MNLLRRRFLGSSLVVLGSSLLEALTTPLWKWRGSLRLEAAPVPNPSVLNPPAASQVQFVDVAREAGLTIPNVWGGTYHKKYIIEAKGSGLAFFDYDHDGWLDIYLTNGTRFNTDWPSGKAPTSHLFHNNGDGTFTDVTRKAGVYDEQIRWGAGCTWLDYDRDGRLDLFICNYIKLDPEKTPSKAEPAQCQWKGIPVMCGPRGLTGDTNVLFHNNGDGTFTDVCAKSGILKPGPRYSITAVSYDFDNDGWPDIYVAVDSEPSILFHNNHDGTFTDIAVIAGCAFNDDGTFADATFTSGIGANTQYVAWGCGFVDYDNDGWPDIIQVNGHVYPGVDSYNFGETFKNQRLVYKNLGNGRFKDVSADMGPGITERFSSRGAAFGDYDNDGSMDALILNMNDLPSLLHNVGGSKQNWVKLKLVGTKCNRTAIGARARVITGKHIQMDEVHSGTSVMSQNDLRLHFGLGKIDTID